ncbi:MAG: valine--pyruvate transaminase [Desulfobulbaceae bacterium]|nr:valine--pyruvate transaminase [Desulfobulbaceae bacterium]
MNLSAFGKKFTASSGITELMDDLGSAMASADSSICMLGGGNPAHIKEVENIFRSRMDEILRTPLLFEKMVGNYDAASGNAAFIQALAALLSSEFGWPLTAENIALTNGSQNAFFCLFNLFAGECSDNKFKKILFPLAPEYIGYADSGLKPGMFTARRPDIETIGDDLFKYHVDFDALKLTDEIGAVCVSRPTNPTGNVLTDQEMRRLDEITRERGIPFIIDNAYGTPFPNIIFTKARPLWNSNTVVCMSLSKFGLPGCRTGIVIARPRIIRALGNLNGILNLAPGSIGATLALELVGNGDIIKISREIVQPYYKRRMKQALGWLREELQGLPYRVHKPEGALFLWLWFTGLKISSRELYARLKKRKVLVIAGEYFFPGLEEEWSHCHECIRITYSQDEAAVRKGIRIIAEEVKKTLT